MQISVNGKLVTQIEEKFNVGEKQGTYLIIQQLFNPVSFTVLTTDVCC